MNKHKKRTSGDQDAILGVGRPVAEAVKTKHRPLSPAGHGTWRLLLSAAVIAAVALGAWRLGHHVDAVESWLAHLGPWAGVGFVLLFVVLTPLLFSVDLLCVVAGTLFPLPWAIAYMVVATLLSATVIYYLGRGLARDEVQRLLRRYPKLLVYEDVIADNGAEVMFLLRLLPLPFAPMGYLFAVSGARFLPYLLASSGIFLYNSTIIYFGYAARHLSRHWAGGRGFALHDGLLAGGVLGAIVVIYLIARLARAKIERLRAKAPPAPPPRGGDGSRPWSPPVTAGRRDRHWQ